MKKLYRESKEVEEAIKRRNILVYWVMFILLFIPCLIATLIYYNAFFVVMAVVAMAALLIFASVTDVIIDLFGTKPSNING